MKKLIRWINEKILGKQYMEKSEYIRIVTNLEELVGNIIIQQKEVAMKYADNPILAMSKEDQELVKILQIQSRQYKRHSDTLTEKTVILPDSVRSK